MRNLNLHSFKFDRVFSPESSQEEVFDNAKSLVDSCLDGYNVTVFAFGMTGSGKTHTIMGTDQAPGILPRSIESVFSELANRSKSDPSEVVVANVCCVELYNNLLHDLLEHVPPGCKPTALKLFEHPVKGISITGTNTLHVPVATAAEALHLVQAANKRRSTNATNYNEYSSRSHCVITLELISYNTSLNGSSSNSDHQESHQLHALSNASIIRQSKLHFVDLAGSENVKISGAAGEVLEEAKQINKSLSILGDVLSALCKNNVQSSHSGVAVAGADSGMNPSSLNKQSSHGKLSNSTGETLMRKSKLVSGATAGINSNNIENISRSESNELSGDK